jgi:predicted peroxiredoxin
VAPSQPTLVLISEDPRTSHRANEAMRIALGIVAGDNEVRIVLSGPAVHLLDEDTDDLVDGDDIAKFRASLRKLGVPFHVEGRLPTAADWNSERHQVVAVSRDEIAAMVPKASRFLVF